MTIDTQSGRVLQETYRIERRLGKGSVGSVFEATHQRLPRRFAIKFLHGRQLVLSDVKRRFQREAQILCELRHRNIVDVVDYNTTPEGVPYIVMELLAGETLRRRLQREAPLPIETAGRLLTQIGEALQTAHDRGVVHRDLKPANIFICPEGDNELVKVLDFGVSKVDSEEQLTGAVAIIGTPWYMSPEQVVGRSAMVTRQTDIFATGVLLYEMLTGEMPFRDEDRTELFRKIAFSDPPPPRSIRPDLPPQLQRVLLRAMRKEPTARHGSMRELVDDFHRASTETDGAELPTADNSLATKELDASTSAPNRTGPMLAGAPTLQDTTVHDTTEGESIHEATADLRSNVDEYSNTEISHNAGTELLVSQSNQSLAGAAGSALPTRSNVALIALIAGIVIFSIALLSWFVSRPESPQNKGGQRAIAGAAHNSPDAGQPRSLPLDEANDAAATTAVDTSTDDAVELSTATADQGSAPTLVSLRRRPAKRHPRYGYLTVVTTHAGQEAWANIRLDGRRIGRSIIYRRRVRAGRHRIEARRSGYGPASRTIRLRAGQVLRVHLDLPSR